VLFQRPHTPHVCLPPRSVALTTRHARTHTICSVYAPTLAAHSMFPCGSKYLICIYTYMSAHILTCVSAHIHTCMSAHTRTCIPIDMSVNPKPQNETLNQP
jgi:hypothetical protein